MPRRAMWGGPGFGQEAVGTIGNHYSETFLCVFHETGRWRRGLSLGLASLNDTRRLWATGLTSMVGHPGLI